MTEDASAGTASTGREPSSPGTESPAGRHQPIFLHLLGNTLVVSVINFTVWFAVTFWVFLETRSVFATGVIAGIFLTLRPSPASGSEVLSIITASGPS